MLVKDHAENLERNIPNLYPLGLQISLQSHHTYPHISTHYHKQTSLWSINAMWNKTLTMQQIQSLARYLHFPTTKHCHNKPSESMDPTYVYHKAWYTSSNIENAHQNSAAETYQTLNFIMGSHRKMMQDKKSSCQWENTSHLTVNAS